MRNLAGGAEADDAGNIERARPHAALVPAPVNDGRELHARVAPAHVERAHALGPVHLVGGDGGEVHVHLLHVEGHLADGLDGVGVEEHFLLFGDLPDFLNRLQHADFVVGVHDGDEDGLVGDSSAQLVQINQAFFAHRQVGDLAAVLLQPLAGVEHGFVLGDGGYDVVAFLAVHLGHALDGQVVGLSGAGGEDDLLRSGVDEGGDLLAGGVNPLLGLPAEAVVAAGGVAELVGEVRQHRLQHPRVHRGGSVVIHING